MVGRFLAGLFAVVAGFYAVFGLFVVIIQWDQKLSVAAGLFSLNVFMAIGSVAGVCGWYACSGKEWVKRGISQGFLWGTLSGFFAFVAGFSGPLIFMPGAEQGPLLGFMIGPIGAYLGFVSGFAVAVWRKILEGDREVDHTLT